jgi:RHS repeat-associated protein
MYREDGAEVWTCKLNSYGRVRKYEGQTKTECPFRYQGQYEDAETGLYYNRFRYYSPEEGMYISQDPICLWGGRRLYSYVQNPNYWVDILGLKKVNVGDTGAFGDLKGETGDGLTAHHMPQDALGHLPRNDGGAIVITQQEHEQTRTYGGRGNATKAEDADKPFRDVLIKDIEDLRSISGEKYDSSIDDLIAYYEKQGMLEEGELTLESIKDGSCHKHN